MSRASAVLLVLAVVLVSGCASSAPPPPSRPAARPFETVHPVVRVHPETGRKALYLNFNLTRSISGLNEAEAQELLAELRAHLDSMPFYSHKWTLGDVVADTLVITSSYGCGSSMLFTVSASRPIDTANPSLTRAAAAFRFAGVIRFTEPI